MSSKPRVAFVITNDRHHWQMTKATVAALEGQCELVLLSFCELRGLRTPTEAARQMGMAVHKVVPRRWRRSPGSGEALIGGVRRSSLRDAAYRLVWAVLSLRCKRQLLAQDLVVLFNDAAFPGAHIARTLRHANRRFLLVQEGIRFPLPTEAGRLAYGAGRANRIACWGQASADHFMDESGASQSQLVVTGNPGHDARAGIDWGARADAARRNGSLPKQAFVLFATNPVDDQGFCSTREKLQAFAQFCEDSAPLLGARNMLLLVRLHGRESETAYRDALPTSCTSVRFSTAGSDLTVEIAAADAVVVWASTVGLEALMQGKPLGVLATPNQGFVFDYVQSNAAVGLVPGEGVARDLGQLLDEPFNPVAQRYLDRQLSHRGNAASRVAREVLMLAALSQTGRPGQ